MPRVVAFYSAHRPELWLRQTPHGRGLWGDTLVAPNARAEDADALVVYDVAPEVLRTRVPRERRILFLTEPPDLKAYSRSFLSQFGVVVSPFPLQLANVRVLRSHTALPWHLGLANPGAAQTVNLNFEDLVAMPPPSPSAARLSVVTSNKARLPQQKARLRFVETLKEKLGENLLVYGRGVRDIADKYEAIREAPFHLVLENNVEPQFWTEKLADSYLGWAFPVYAGAPEASRDFPAGAMMTIDISDPTAAARAIAERLSRGLSPTDLEALQAARRKLLFEHNLFAMIDRIAADLPAAAPLRRAQRIHNYEENSLKARLRQFKRNTRRRLAGA